MVLKQPAPLVGPVCLNSCTICPRLCTSMYHRKQNKAKELCHRGSPQPQSILLSQPRCPVIFKAHTIGHDSLMPVHVIWAAQFAEQRFHRWLTAIRIHQHTRCELVFSLYILSCPLSLSLSQALSIWETYSYCPCAHLAGSGMISAGDWVGISGSWTVLCFFFCFFFSRPRCLYGICFGLAGQREQFQRSPRTPVCRHWAERAQRIGRRNVSSATCQPSAPGTWKETYQRTLVRVAA